MTTVINTPGNGDSSGGLIVGIVVAVVVLALFFLYALPAMRGNNAPADDRGGINVNVDLPANNTGGEAPTN